jgi:hypothetical protein
MSTSSPRSSSIEPFIPLVNSSARLNFAVATTPPSVGSNPLPDTAYVNSTNPDDYGANTGNLGIFGQGTGWSPYSAAVEFSTPSDTPEPSSLLLLGSGLLFLAGVCLRRSRPSKIK